MTFGCPYLHVISQVRVCAGARARCCELSWLQGRKKIGSRSGNLAKIFCSDRLYNAPIVPDAWTNARAHAHTHTLPSWIWRMLNVQEDLVSGSSLGTSPAGKVVFV